MKALLVLLSGVVSLVLGSFPALAAAPSTILERAILATEQANFSEALAQLDTLPVASLSPQERKRARYLEAHVSLKLKRFPEALYAFGETVDQYPELGDYAIWNVARLYKELHAERFAMEALRLLLGRFPQSRLIPQGRLTLARELIEVTGELASGVHILEEFLREHPGDPRLPEVYVLLGRGYEGLSEPQKAIDTYRALYIRFPASPEAEQAWTRLETLLPGKGRSPTALTPSEQLDRADRLAAAGECERAMQEVRQTVPETLPVDLLGRATFRLGLCAFKLRRYREAAVILERFLQGPFADEQAGEALYTLGLSHQRDGRTAEAEQTFKRLVSRAPSTAWNAKALSALGLLYETRQDTERACAAYAELMTRFPTEDRADEMAWRIGWLRYGQRSYGTAAREFAAAAARFPQSLFVSNALYWQAKTLEKNGNSSPAMALYARVAREYPYTYYGIRAEEILLARTSSSGPVRNGLLATHPLSPGEPSPRFTAAPTLSPQALFHRVRVDELLALRFLEDAREEVGQLAKRLGAGFTEQLFLAGLYLNIGQTTQAIRILNATLSTVDPDARLTLPNDFWTLLFPQLYWEEVQESAQQSQLDPLLLLGVIRQESAFNARAVSRSDARGLMQLLPSTGRELAQQLRMGPFQTEVLFDPRVNVRLGAHYLQRLTGVHQGNVILALAAYNAGPTRVKRWLQEMGIADWDEFVEGLPFEETRSYVKSVLRNYGVYRKLYAVGTITTDERR